MSEENLALVRRFFDELWNFGNLAVLDELMDVNCDGDLMAGLLPPSNFGSLRSFPPARSSITERLQHMAATHPVVAKSVITRFGNFRGLKKNRRSLLEAFPDMRCTIDEMVAEKDHVLARWTLRGTFQTEGGLPPKGKTLVLPGAAVLRIGGERIQEYYSYWDPQSFRQQLGLWPRWRF